jgi:hypothetical protein
MFLSYELSNIHFSKAGVNKYLLTKGHIAVTQSDHQPQRKIL